MSTTIQGRSGFGPVGADVDQSVRYPLDEIGSDVSTLLGPAVVLAAIIGTLRIALSQPDQTATTKTRSRRAPESGSAASEPAPTGAGRRAERSADPRGGRSPVPVMMSPPAPAGFRWMDATPVPRVRSGFALVVILAVLGALLAVAVAGLVIGAAVAIQGAVG